jgi:hypothetical protein
MKSLVVALFFVVLCCLAVSLSSSTATAQGFDRDSCLRGCAWLRPTGKDFGGWMNYSNCMADCEKRFWKEFDDQTRELEQERDKN